MWVGLNQVQQDWHRPWVIGGDFIVVRYPLERSGNHQLTSQMCEFSNFISICGLLDLA